MRQGSMFYAIAVMMISISLAACSPTPNAIVATQVPTSAPTVLPTTIPTTQPTPVPTIAPTIIPTTLPTSTSIVAPTATSTPEPISLVGRFVSEEDPQDYFIFTKIRWTHWHGNLRGASGGYRIEGDIYIQTSNSAGCPVPMSYKYSFDGKRLNFQYTPESSKDTCGDRPIYYNNKTYILSK